MGGLMGGCQCGAVRYRLAVTPKGATLCHCRMCQKVGGGPFMAFAPLPFEAFEITKGALKTFRSSEIAERGFCDACGTPLTYRALDSARISITLGTLDDIDATAPTDQLAREAAPAWLEDSLHTPNTTLADWLKGRRVGDRQITGEAP